MTQEEKDAVTDFINELADSVKDLMICLHNHMAPDVQETFQRIDMRIGTAMLQFEKDFV